MPTNCISLGVIPHNNFSLYHDKNDFFPSYISKIDNVKTIIKDKLVDITFNTYIDNSLSQLEINSDWGGVDSLRLSLKFDTDETMTFTDFISKISWMLKYIYISCSHIKTIIDLESGVSLNGHNINVVIKKKYFLSVLSFSVNCFRNDTDKTSTICTKGLSRFGLPEIRISKVSAAKASQCKKIVSACASFIVTGDQEMNQPLLLGYDIECRKKITVQISTPTHIGEYGNIICYECIDDYINNTPSVLEKAIESYSNNLFFLSSKYDIKKSRELCHSNIEMAIKNISNKECKVIFQAEDPSDPSGIVCVKAVNFHDGVVIGIKENSDDFHEEISVPINNIFYWAIYVTGKKQVNQLSIYSSIYISASVVQ